MSISTRVLVASAVIAVALLGAFIPLIVSLDTTYDAELAEDRSERQAKTAGKVLSHVVDMQTGTRGYIITQNARFLEPTRNAKRGLPEELRRLVSVAGATPRVRRMATSIARAVRSYRRDYIDPLVAVARVSPRRASEIAATAEGKRRVDAIRHQSARLISLTDAEAARQEAAARRAEARAIRLAVGGLGGVLLFVFLSAVYLRRSIGRPVQRLSSAADRFGEGGLQTRVPEDGPREYARLARSFNNMAASLQSSRGKLELANRELEASQAEAEQANEAKSDFLSRMSHELRTPLNSVLGFAELLWMDGIAGEQRDFVGQIRKSGMHLLDLINEVLDISRIEAGQMSISPEPVQLRGAVAEAVEMIAPEAAARGIALEPEYGAACDCYVRADQQRLKQVLLNLLSNAVKYNRPGGSVRICCTEGDGDAPRVAVIDTGRGIPEDQLDRLFSPFDRLGAEQGEEGGTGLGLALSKRLVELMDGKLWAESEVGCGTTFWLELAPAHSPTAPALPSSPDEHVAADPSDAELTVLYIEDNAANFELIKSALARMGSPTLLSAIQGGLGVDLAVQHQPDLVLLDLHLPDIPGAEVLRKLKSDPRTSSIPVIILSADATQRQVRRLLDGGAYEYLAKPIDIPRFLETVQRAAGERKAAV